MIGFIIRHPILATAAAVIIALNFTDAPLSHAFEKANVSEVMGLDANASGLRDDVESWIQGLYPEAAHPIRVAAEQLGKAYQLGMLAFHENSPALKNNAIQAYGIAQACVGKHFSPEAAAKINAGIEKAMGNTSERAQYVVALKAQHARVVNSNPGTYSCPY
ncbi:hypothetical protein [Thauera mechernichensis]